MEQPKRKNAKETNKKNKKENCNCPDEEEEEQECPLLEEGCLEKAIVYQADVITGEKKPVKIYYGQTEKTFKKRYTSHKHTFNHRDAQMTTLSTYVWKCRDKGVEPEIKWSVKARGHPFSSGSKKCDLCLTEKTVILYADKTNIRNSRNELMEKCRHKKKFTLKTCQVELAPHDPP